MGEMWLSYGRVVVWGGRWWYCDVRSEVMRVKGNVMVVMVR